MSASELVEAHPAIHPATAVADAAEQMVTAGLPGLVVTHGDGRPYAVLSGEALLRLMLPGYLRDDPGLARTLDAAAADEACRRLARGTIGDLVPSPRPRDELPVVELRATSLEVAAVLARTRSPLVAVVDGSRVVGAVTAARVLRHVLAGPAT